MVALVLHSLFFVLWTTPLYLSDVAAEKPAVDESSVLFPSLQTFLKQLYFNPST